MIMVPKRKRAYYAKLPRRIHGKGECQWLTDEGEKCTKSATIEDITYPDHETRHDANWMAVRFCLEHWRTADGGMTRGFDA